MRVLIIARAAGGRPSLQHALMLDDPDRSECGLDVTRWSRAYTKFVIPQVMCQKCARKELL